MQSFANKTILKAGLSSLIVSIFFSCGNFQKKGRSGFTYRLPGYYYQLLAFSEMDFAYRAGDVAWVEASFKTQSDSVFWDSFNNLGDHFFLRIDSTVISDAFKKCISVSSPGDSGCILVRNKDFFEQYYRMDSIPFFSELDSVVKVNFKVKQILTEEEFSLIRQDLRKKEKEAIAAYFPSIADFEASQDALGFYWITKPELRKVEAGTGEKLTITYKGYFLNGRFLESSPAKFELLYGTPDQLVKGLNYVIGKIKVGAFAKIILPSGLAFGEEGSSNGTVPPYTPLLYEIQIIEQGQSY
jgi:FKBP-type peptidyl-prolyl cis-trans isomerase